MFKNNALKFSIFIILFLPYLSSSQQEFPDSLLVISPPSEKILDRIGVFGSLNYVIHQSSFQNLPGIGNCCPQFDNGNGWGFAFGAVTEFDLSADFRLSFNPYFDLASGEHLYNEHKVMGINGIDYDGIIEHSVLTEMYSIGLQPAIEYRIEKDIFLKFGIDGSYNIRAAFEQSEKLIEPSKFGAFENGKRVRNEVSGDIADYTAFQISILLGASYEIPLNKQRTHILAPEIKLLYGLTPIINNFNWNNNYNWNMHRINIGAAYKYEIPESLPDTVYPSLLKLTGRSYDFDGIEAEIASINIYDYLQCGEFSSQKVSIEYYIFEPELFTKSKIKNYSFVISQNDSVLREIKASDKVPSSIEWVITDDIHKIKPNAEPLKFALSVTTEDDILTSNIMSAQVKKRSFDISTEVSCLAYDKEGNLNEFDIIEFKETKSTNMRPFLNYVFFDKNSGIIPKRYKKISKEESADFKIEDLGDMNALETYYNLLNILGMRLREYPDAKIVLTGCNSDGGVEKQNKGLSVSRAYSIKRYLKRVWDVSYDRIKILGRNLPKNASKTSEKEHYNKVRDENRRVEIASDDWRVLSPIVTFDTLRSIKPEKLRFEFDTQSDIQIESAEFSVSIDNNELIRINNDDLIESVVEFEIEKNRFSFPNRNGYISYSYNAINEESKTCNARDSIPYVIQIEDTTYDKYSLILFDFNSSKLSDENARIAEYIDARIAKDKDGNILGRVTVIGSTDNIGSLDYNLNLSKERVRSVVDYLELDKKNVQFSGMGEDVLIHPVELPEGRLYCRTVTIIVKNPNNWKPEK